MSADLLSPAELEAKLREIGAERYHDRHPFHHLMRDGRLTRGQVPAWHSTGIIIRRDSPPRTLI